VGILAVWHNPGSEARPADAPAPDREITVLAQLVDLAGAAGQ